MGASQIRHRSSAIIRFFASKSLSLFLFGVPGLRRTSITIAALVATSVALLSCGSYNSSSSSSQGSTSGLKFRAFVSNPLRPLSTGTTPVLEIVDALQDKLPGSAINLLGSNPDPGIMVVSPNKKFTLVISASNNVVTVIDNARESLAQSGSGVSPSVTLPGFSDSVVVGSDNLTAYAAVSTTPVVGQSPGAVEVMNLSTGSISATLPVSGAHTIVGSHNGNRILAFGDLADTVTVIAPSLVGTNADPRTTVQDSAAFDHPVWAIFSSDDSTAYILNCGPECGGAAASVTVFDLNTNTPGINIPVDAATIGLLSGSTLYVAGTPPGTACGSGTAATTCGMLDIIDLTSMTIIGSTLITDGDHDRMELGANGQIFIGARACTNINIPAVGSNPGEVRGCLSIFNTGNSSVVVPPDNGDVTGLQPITNRNVVYVVQQGELRIYDTTTDKLQSTQIDILGQAIDVKLVD